MGLQINTGATFTRTGMPTLFTPAALGSSLLGWYRADTNVTSALDTTTSVTRASAVADSGPLGINLIQASASIAMAVIPATQAGKNGLQNDNTTNVQRFLATATSPLPSATVVPLSMVLVFRKINNLVNTGNEVIVGFGSEIILQMNNAAGGVLNFNTHNAASSGDGFGARGSTTLLNGKPYIVILTADGTGKAAGVQLYINGIAETMTTTLDAYSGIGGSPGTYHMGNPTTPADFNVHFEEVLVNRVLVASEIQAMTTYLNQRWLVF